MWIFCEQGFFSAVEHREQRDHVLIRARFEGDLERLITRYLPEQKDELIAIIQYTEYADYAYRVKLSKSVFAEITKQIAENINYDNFKNHVHEGHNSKRDRAYMDCWAALWRAQNHR